MDLQEAFDAGFAEVKEYIDAEFKTLHRTIKSEIDAIPPARDGIDGKDGKDVDWPKIEATIVEAIKAIPPAQDGKDGESAVVDYDLIQRFVIEEVAKINPIPGPQGEPGAQGVPGERGDPAELSVAPDDVAEKISKAIAFIDQPLLPPVVHNQSAAPAQQHITIALPPQQQVKKKIVTRRDADGNLIADVTEL